MKLSKIIRCGAAALSLFTVNALALPSSQIECGGVRGILTIDADFSPIISCSSGAAFLYTGIDNTNKFAFSATFNTSFSEIILSMSTGFTSGVGADATWDFKFPVGQFETVELVPIDGFALISVNGTTGTVFPDGSAKFTVDDDLSDMNNPYRQDATYLAKYTLTTTGVVPGPDLPEPMSLALVGIALGALGVTRRKAARV